MDEILDLERAGWSALCDGSGSAFYGDLMTDDARMVLANGVVMDRAQVVEALAGAPAWDSYSIDDPRLIGLHADAVALVYTGTGQRGDQRFVGVMSSVYVRIDGRWRLALYQQTPTS